MQLHREAWTACTDQCSQNCSSGFYPTFTEETSARPHKQRKENTVGKGGEEKTYVDHGWRDISLRLPLRVQTLHDFAAPIRTLRARTELELAPAIQSRRALFDVLEWLLAGAHNASRAHPVLRCLELQNLAARIDGLATECAELWCILGDDLVSQQVPFQNIANVVRPYVNLDTKQGTEAAYKGWSLKPPSVVGIPSVNWLTTNSSSSTSSRCFDSPDHIRL